MNDEDIRWMNVKIIDYGSGVRVDLAKRNTISGTEIKCLNAFAEKNNLTLLGILVDTNPFHTIFIKK